MSDVRGEGASPVAQILTEPVSAPSVWTGDELSGTGHWVIHFTEEDLADFGRALANVPEEHVRDVTQIRAEDFPLPHFQERIAGIVDRLERGVGFVLLRGLPIYDDPTDPARQRHLLRLWISRPEGGRPLCPEYAAWRSGYPT
jgi:hypothetical protein